MNAEEMGWRFIASHESGHALAAVVLGVPVRSVWLDRDWLISHQQFRGGTETPRSLGDTDPWRAAVVSAAGLAAEPWSHGDDDLAYVAQLVGEDRVQDALDEAAALLRPYRARVLPSLVNLLVAEGRIDGARLAELVTSSR